MPVARLSSSLDCSASPPDSIQQSTTSQPFEEPRAKLRNKTAFLHTEQCGIIRTSQRPLGGRAQKSGPCDYLFTAPRLFQKTHSDRRRRTSKRYMPHGHYPASSVLDMNCKAHDLDNLYVVDASFSFRERGESVAHDYCECHSSCRARFCRKGSGNSTIKSTDLQLHLIVC